MPLTFTTLGHVLLHIYDIDFGASIYLPPVARYESDTPCVIALPVTGTEDEVEALQQICVNQGFKNWLNVAVVSDTCDTVAEKTEPCLLAAFNADCRAGGWLWKMMNYRHTAPPS